MTNPAVSPDPAYYSGLANKPIAGLEHYTTPQSPKPPKRPSNGVIIALIVVFGLIAIAVIGALGENSKDRKFIDSNIPTAEPASPTYPKNPLATVPKKNFFTDMNGQFLVGDGVGQVPAGTYLVDAVPNRGGGYWARCSDFSCQIGNPGRTMIRSGYIRTGSEYLVIDPSDQSVKLNDVTLAKVVK